MVIKSCNQNQMTESNVLLFLCQPEPNPYPGGNIINYYYIEDIEGVTLCVDRNKNKIS